MIYEATSQKTVTFSMCFTSILIHLRDFAGPEETQFLFWYLVRDIHMSPTAGGKATHKLTNFKENKREQQK